MKVVSEFDLINQIKSIINNPTIGDDCALYQVGKKNLLLKVDCLVEDRHFLISFPQHSLGFKAISVAVSDIVSSGGIPKSVLISLVLPKKYQYLVPTIYQSIKQACQLYRCQVIGGNISSGKSLEIHSFVIGESKKFISRRQAKINDDIYLTQATGMARAGLELLLAKKKTYLDYEKDLIKFHLRPTVDIKLGLVISRYASSSIDISDGLLSDMSKLSQYSRVKMVIKKDCLPVNHSLIKYCNSQYKNIFNYQLFSGEDYVVVFTACPKYRQYLKKFFLIGKVEKGSGVLVDNQLIEDHGFDHFKK